MRSVIALCRLTAYGIQCLILIPPQALLCLLFPRQSRILYVLPRYFQIAARAIFALKVDSAGRFDPDARLIVANHISYLDIPAMGSLIDCAFIAKAEVAGWPVFGLLAKLQNTVFVSRSASRAHADLDALSHSVEREVPIILFAESTSSDGRDVLPFKPALLSPYLGQDIAIQPATILLESVDGAGELTQERRDRYAWYGEMDLLPHLWAFARGRGAKVRIVWHESIPAQSHDDRKKLAASLHETVRRGLTDGPQPRDMAGETDNTAQTTGMSP